MPICEAPVVPAVCERFRLAWPMPVEVARADKAPLYVEAQALI